MAEVLNCDLEESEFQLQWHYDVYFWTDILKAGMNSVIQPAMG